MMWLRNTRFPNVSCPALEEEEGVGSVIVDATELEQIQANEVCELGQKCVLTFLIQNYVLWVDSNTSSR